MPPIWCPHRSCPDCSLESISETSHSHSCTVETVPWALRATCSGQDLLAQILPGLRVPRRSSSSGNDSKRAWCRLCQGQGVNRATLPRCSKYCYPAWVPVTCLLTVPVETSGMDFLHPQQPESVPQNPRMEQLGHAEGRSSQLPTLLPPLPTLKVTPRSHRNRPPHDAHLIQLFFPPGQQQTSSRPFAFCG